MDEPVPVSERALGGRRSRSAWVVLTLALAGAIAFAGSAASSTASDHAGTTEVVVTR